MRNLSILRRPDLLGSAPAEVPHVSVLIPARNEAKRITPTLLSVLQQDYPRFEIIILDDASTDATSQVVMNLINGVGNARLMSSAEDVPDGWLGKSWACQRLAAAAHGSILIFLDADVRLTPDAISRSVDLMLTSGLDVMCPFPRQTATTLLGRLVQPLLQWSWLTTLPLDVAETSRQPSLTAGNGQFLLITKAMYDGIGGHEAVRAEILEDINLVRRVKAAGGRGGVVDGSDIAQCTMYRTDRELIEGYGKSLWSAFGSTAGAVMVNLLLFMVYVLPAGFWFHHDKATRHRAVTATLSATAGRILINRSLNQAPAPK